MLGPIAKKLYLCLGQTIGEYVVVVALVLAAITAMQVYVQRGLQARYQAFSENLAKTVRDTVDNQSLPSQYEPYYVFSNARAYRGSASQEDIVPGGIGGVVMRRTGDFVARNEEQIVLPSCAAGEAGCPEDGGSVWPCAYEWQDCSEMPCCSEDNFCTGTQCVPCGHAGADCSKPNQACCSGFYCDSLGTGTCLSN